MIKEVRKKGGLKRDLLWEKINEKVGKEVYKEFKKIILEMKREASNGKNSLLYNLGERNLSYEAKNSKEILDQIFEKKIRDLDTGKGYTLDLILDSIFSLESDYVEDIRVNLLAEKLINLLKKEDFRAEKFTDSYTAEDGASCDFSYTYTRYYFGLKIIITK